MPRFSESEKSGSHTGTAGPIAAGTGYGSGISRLPVSLPASILLLASALPAFAHDESGLTDETAWTTWQLTPDIVILTALASAVYIAGALRRGGTSAPSPWWRHAMFAGGLASIFVALQSPIDPIAEHLFSVHQIQHLLLRMIGPMLITLSLPMGILSAGLRATVGQRALRLIASSGTLRGFFHFLALPLVTTIVFIAALAAWEIPLYHNLAILNDSIHYAMHVTMLAAGLLFWWRVFDRRAPPQGASYGTRLMMLWVVTISNILIGALTTLKGTALYDAYHITGRLFDVSAMADEQLGGVIIWIPSSMMCLIAILVVIHNWGQHETKMLDHADRGTLLQSPSSAVFAAQQRPKNKALALGLATFVAAIFALALFVGLAERLFPDQAPASKSGNVPVQHAMHLDSSIPQ